MRQSPCIWALGAAVAIGLVVAGAASTTENAAVPQDIALSSAGGATSATAAPPTGSDRAEPPGPASAPEQSPHAAPLRARVADAFAEYRPSAGIRGLTVVVAAGERTSSERHNPRRLGDPDAAGVRLGSP
ncbi:hypothetical protein LP52_00385 [Streptomonospora alba]|uniref:Uncharacterized protein n=1 Tax=Streptomonospora alba TaxID=183763 RepID=A0A0C2GB37_9ACTN|nr:hypothetical protein [Streptomonospora alba]KII00604.1 hypothetical protein LP52_00385 [Streptomonospora alba]